MIQRRCLASLIAFSLFSATIADSVAVFDLYPAASRSCLSSASTASKCDDSTVEKYNPCVCSNGGGFLDNAAKCLGSKDRNDLTVVFNTLKQNCQDSNSPLSYDAAKWNAAAGSASSGTTTAGTTKLTTSVQTITAATLSSIVSTITLAPTSGQTTGQVSVVTLSPGQTTTLPIQQATVVPQPSNQNKGLSTGAIVGIAVGVPCFFALLGLIGFMFWHSRRQKYSAVQPAPSLPGADGHDPSLPYGGTPVAAKMRPESSFISSEGSKYDPQQTGSPHPPSVYGYPQQFQPQPYDPYHQQYQGYHQPQTAYQPPLPGVVEAPGAPITTPQELPGHPGHK